MSVSCPIYEGNGGLAVDTGAYVDIPFPSVVNENDMLIVTVFDNDNDSFSIPSGWTKAREYTNSARISGAVFWKRAIGDESGVERFVSASSSGQYVMGVMHRFSGASLDDAPWTNVRNTEQNTTCYSANFTTYVPYTLTTWMVGVREDGITPKNLTMARRFWEEHSTGPDGTMFCYTRCEPSTIQGKQGSVFIFETGSEYWLGWQVHLLPYSSSSSSSRSSSSSSSSSNSSSSSSNSSSSESISSSESFSSSSSSTQYSTSWWTQLAPKLNAQSITGVVVYNGKIYGGTAGSGRLFEWNGVDAWVQVAPTLGGFIVVSLCVYNSKIYGGTSGLGRLFEWNGVDAWIQVAPQFNSQDVINTLYVFNDKLYAGTGAGGRLFEWNDVDAWVEKAPKHDYETFVRELIAFNGKLYGGTSPFGNLLEWNGSNAWVEKAPYKNGQGEITYLAVFNNKLYASTGTNTSSGRLFEWNESNAWVEKAPTLNDQAINCLIEHKSELYGGSRHLTDGAFLYKWNGVDAWIKVADSVSVEDSISEMVIFGGSIYGGTNPDGYLWRFDESSSSSSSQSSSSSSSSYSNITSSSSSRSSSSRSSSSNSSSSFSSSSSSHSSSSLSSSSSSSSFSSSSSSRSLSSSSSSSSISFLSNVRFGENTVDDYTGDTEDSHMDEQNPTSQEDTNLLLVGEDAGGQYTSWIKFKLTDKIYNATISRAYLGIYVASAVGTMGNNSLTIFQCVTSDPVEDELTWNIRKIGTNWAAGGALGGNYDVEDDEGYDIEANYINYGQIPTAGQYWYIDITELIKIWVDRSRKELGMILVMSDPTDDYLLTITDSEGTDGQRPFLSIWYAGGESYSSVSSSSLSVSSSSSSSSSLSSSSSSSSKSSESISVSSQSISFSRSSSSSSSQSSESSSSSSSSKSSTSISFSSSSSSSTSTSSASYRKKRYIGYICCNTAQSEIRQEDYETDHIDIDYENNMITTWIKKNDGKPMRNRVIAQFAQDYQDLGIRPCWAPQLDGTIFINRSSIMGINPRFAEEGEPLQIPRDMESYPKIYYDNPTHCQWYNTSIHNSTKVWSKAESDLILSQGPVGGNEVKETKAEVIPGQGRRELTVTQNQIVPGAAVTLSWSYYDGTTAWEYWAFTHTWFNTKYLTGGKVTWKNPNRYGSGDMERWIPFVKISCNGLIIPAFGSGWVDWDPEDWVFTIIRPIDKDATQWNTDERIDEDDLRKCLDTLEGAYEDHLLIVPIKIGNYGD